MKFISSMISTLLNLRDEAELMKCVNHSEQLALDVLAIKAAFSSLWGLIDSVKSLRDLLEHIHGEIKKCPDSNKEKERLTQWLESVSDASSLIMAVSNNMALSIPRLLVLHGAFYTYLSQG